MSLAPRSDTDPEELAKSRGERALARLKRRDAPKFFIMNPNGEVEFSSPNLVESELLARSKRLLAELTKPAALTHPLYEELGADMMLRVVPLAGELGGYLAAFIEDGRNALEVASERYNLTKRESEVLGYVLKGFSSPRIAHSLFISDGTVGDHVKSIFRKTGTNSRSELVVRILERDSDPLPSDP